jgi:hypothetical protein
VMAPGVVELVPEAALGGYSGSISGTSFSSPIVAGVATLFRDETKRLGWSYDGRLLKAALLAMGDRADDSVFSSSLPPLTSGLSSLLGAGRIKARYPGAASFANAAWAWGYYSATLVQGQETCIAVGNTSGFSQFKWGLTWDEPTPFASADLDISVKDMNAGGTVVAFQNDYGVSNRIALDQAALAGRNLSICVLGYTIPAGQTRQFFTSYFLHNNGAD